MMLHYCGMMLVIITYEYAHASDFSQRRETNPASRHLLASEKRSIKEPLNVSKIGHLKFFVELRPKESNDVQELFMHKVRRRRDLSTIIDDILHSGHYHHMYPPNQDFLTQLKHSADSGTLTSLIGSMGYSSVLKLMENLTPTDAHKLNSAIIKVFHKVKLMIQSLLNSKCNTRVMVSMNTVSKQSPFNMQLFQVV